jgi:hypothetical protein
MPAEQKGLFKSQMDQMKAGWAAMAGTAEAKAPFEATCTQMSTTMKPSMTQFGCEW